MRTPTRRSKDFCIWKGCGKPEGAKAPGYAIFLSFKLPRMKHTLIFLLLITACNPVNSDTSNNPSIIEPTESPRTIESNKPTYIESQTTKQECSGYSGTPESISGADVFNHTWTSYSSYAYALFKITAVDEYNDTTSYISLRQLFDVNENSKAKIFDDMERIIQNRGLKPISRNADIYDCYSFASALMKKDKTSVRFD